MQSKDLRSLLLKLNNYLVRNLDTATGMGIKAGHYEITIEHLIVVLLEDGQGDVPLILRHFGIDAGQVQAICNNNLDEMNSGNPGKPKLSPLLTELLEQAWIASSVHHKETKIRSGALFEVLSLRAGHQHRFDGYARPHQARSCAASLSIRRRLGRRCGYGSRSIARRASKEIPPGGSVLDLYTANLTAQAKAGKIDPFSARR
jgi:type VI secretion system protein VasG